MPNATLRLARLENSQKSIQNTLTQIANALHNLPQPLGIKQTPASKQMLKRAARRIIAQKFYTKYAQ